MTRREANAGILVSAVVATDPVLAVEETKTNVLPQPRSSGGGKPLIDALKLRLCVPKTLSALIGRRNHLTCVDHVRIVLLRPGRLGLAIQVEDST